MSPKRGAMVVDPPDGRVPVMKWAEDKRDYDLAHLEDAPQHETPWVRCITRGVPGGMFPAGYNNGYEIFQIPGYVVIVYEMIHDTRIIPLDGRPHLGENIRLWNGDARGRFEGNTLVVETHELQRQRRDRDERSDGADTRHPAQRGVARRRALHAHQRGRHQLRGHDHGSQGLHRAVDRGIAVEPRPELFDVRVRVPRRKSRAAERSTSWPRA